MITVKRESDLEIQEWIFDYITGGHVLSLWKWQRATRASKRHKWITATPWRRSDWHPPPREPVPPDVLAEARARFIETLKVEA